MFLPVKIKFELTILPLNLLCQTALGVSLGMGSPYKRRDRGAPWHWGMHPNDLHCLNKSMGLSIVLR